MSGDDIGIVRRMCEGGNGVFHDACLAVCDEIVRLRAAVTAIDDLHSPRLAHDTCLACDHDWPCPTILILHPEEARRG